jgi:predicted ATPase/class 3 adenylate cyclase
MTFDETLARVLLLLQQERRVSYRALKRRFGLDDEDLKDLKDEIIEAKQLAIDENGKVLVWTGGPAEAAISASDHSRASVSSATESDTTQLSEDARTEAAAVEHHGPQADQDMAGRPVSYTPRHLVEKVLTSRSALEGERKQVTVLFCDIADSSRFTQQLDPEVLHQLMDQLLRIMAETVHRYEGTVNQYLGDGLMALFGAPVALEDHAFRAMQAALTIQEIISSYNDQLRCDYGVEVSLRQGLNTGLVVVGRIGDDLRMDYTAVGNTTHLASRMQHLAGPGTILLTEATHRLVAGYIHSESLGPLEVKGQREPVRVYKVTRRRRWRSRLEVSAEHGLTTLVGRQRELALLHDCLARVEAGHGQMVSIVGEAGAGKSRLLYELQTLLPQGRVTWLTGQCLAYGQATPYLPFLGILRTAFQIEEDDHLLQVREKLRQGVRRLDPTLAMILPFLEALFGLPGADEALRHLAPKDRRQQTYHAFRALAMSGSQRRPHVLVFEDLHWIDQTSEECLAVLLEGLTDMSVLVLTTHRPGYTVPWTDKTYYTQIALDALTEVETATMVTALLGSQEVPADLLHLIQEKAGGNPLFIEEVIRAFMERGLLGRHNDELRWSGTAVVEFPTTMQDIMQARIDRLAEPVKHTLQTAAVIGREFGLPLLSRLVNQAVAVESSLEALKRVELIHETRFFPEVEYRFKHAVIQDAAYQSLLVQRRRRLHGAIGQTLEELYATRREEHAAILAYHYMRSVYQDKAVAYALLAGDQAARLYAHAEATTYYEQALTMARGAPESPDTQRAQIDASVKLASVGTTRQDMERDAGNLEQARRLAEGLQDEPRLAQVLYWLGRLHYTRGDMPTALTYAERGLALADRTGDEALAAPPVNLVGRVHWILADYVQASQLLARSAEQMHQLENATEEATAAGFAGWAFGFLGELEQGLAYAERGLQLAQELHNPFAEAAAYLYRGAIHDQRGAWAQTLADYQEALRIAAQAGDVFRVYLVKFMQGRAYVMMGDPARGREILEESLAMADQLGTQFILAWPKTYLASCLLVLGEPEAARNLCQEAIQLAEAAGDKYGQFMAHRTLAEAMGQLEPGDLQPIERAMEESIRLQQEIGTQPELARTYVSYARLLQGQREGAKAKTYLMQAMDMFRQMRMTWDLTQAEQVGRTMP